jgi:hypothetical protein
LAAEEAARKPKAAAVSAIGFKYLLALVCIVNSCEFEDV